VRSFHREEVRTLQLWFKHCTFMGKCARYWHQCLTLLTSIPFLSALHVRTESLQNYTLFVSIQPDAFEVSRELCSCMWWCSKWSCLDVVRDGELALRPNPWSWDQEMYSPIHSLYVEEQSRSPPWDTKRC
jgi:hypothetical protein